MGNTSSKLSKSKLKELRDKTKFTEDELKKWHDVFTKEYPNGKMDRATFVAENMYVHGGEEDLWNYLFKILDRDDSGEVDFSEFIVSLSVGTKGSADEKLKWAFNIYDFDGNGTIELPEMEKLLTGIFKMAETHDGDDFDEEAFNKQVKIRSKRIFDKMDTDGDGELTLEEFIQGCKDDPQIISAMNVF
mmetsp:Transcript_6871/g.10050  ORF Transcript_6871/g.10050 Transcript_6871/m.10050 type:complete len:189 (+) Transcript_6871:62-628(+)